MIFVILGTQKQSFKRIIDYAVNSKVINSQEIIIQAGYTKYDEKLNENIKLFDFISKEEFENYMSLADIVISHGGVGSIFTALINEKKVLAIPRLKRFKEHVNDHQIEICEELKNLDYIEYYVPKLEESNNVDIQYQQFDNKIDELMKNDFKKYISNSGYLEILKKEI